MNFPLPLLLPGMWKGGRSESLPLFLPLEVLNGAPMACKNDGKSGYRCHHYLGSDSEDARIASFDVRRAGWIRRLWETVIGEAIGLLGSVKGRFSFDDRPLGVRR